VIEPSIQVIIDSWRVIGLNVENDGKLIPKCTPQDLSTAVDNFFGGGSIKQNKSKKSKQRRGSE
jgi:hypothetical protein